MACLILTWTLGGYYFAFLAHLNHANPYPDDRPQPPGRRSFLEHQLKHTIDVSSRPFGPLTPLALLYLDRQTVHHLFPSIDHSRLPSVRHLVSAARRASLLDLCCRMSDTVNTWADAKPLRSVE